jgi:diacylglycerol kinase family enzyme
VANGRQYGNGAVIAPRARLDDGLLDLVSVDPIGPARALWGLWRLFNGTIDRHPFVRCSRVGGVTISADQSLRFHVDGEVVQGGRSLSAVIHPKALRVRVPRAGG